LLVAGRQQTKESEVGMVTYEEVWDWFIRDGWKKFWLTRKREMKTCCSCSRTEKVQTFSVTLDDVIPNKKYSFRDDVTFTGESWDEVWTAFKNWRGTVRLANDDNDGPDDNPHVVTQPRPEECEKIRTDREVENV
jgi:hypothetical protein